MQLKVLSTLAELAGKNGSTLILPMPIELLRSSTSSPAMLTR